MNPSASLCRAQEAYHRERAAGAQLVNVCAVATKAADAWGREALDAERREARHRRTKAVAGVLAMQKREARDARERDRLITKNPERGFDSRDTGEPR